MFTSTISSQSILSIQQFPWILNLVLSERMAGGRRAYTALFAVLLLVVLIALADVAEAKNRLPLRECKPRCTYRCSATSHKKPCMFFCQKCCATCRCVPPGVYGNKQKCACYNNWKTKEGRPKCP